MDAYLASLIEHETGHRDMVVEAVEDLTARSPACLPRRPVRTRPMVRSLCQERMAKLNDEAKEYDAATVQALSKAPFSPDCREWNENENTAGRPSRPFLFFERSSRSDNRKSSKHLPA